MQVKTVSLGSKRRPETRLPIALSAVFAFNISLYFEGMKCVGFMIKGTLVPRFQATKAVERKFSTKV